MRASIHTSPQYLSSNTTIIPAAGRILSRSTKLGGRLASQQGTSRKGLRQAHPRLDRSVSCSAVALSSSFSNTSNDDDGDNELPFLVYSPGANAEYWHRRPVSVTKRTLQVSSTFGKWFLTGRLRPGLSKEQRANELREILTNLGPAYVKIGQAISSRPDVVPPEFLTQLEKLQDRLPPFPTEQALDVMASELGCPVYDVFSSISPEPVAAASLGQVYKATLRRDGSQVAVKVQRPGVSQSIALDIYVIRYLAAGIRKWQKLNSDLPALLDEWAASLFRELDYRTEAANGVRFAQLYGRLEGVYVPKMYQDLTTRRVLVMEWIDGERLRSAADGSSSTSTRATVSRQDDLRLVEVGVRCSLEQMLEEGFYHADPHPGNLLRTRDGKLAYLDFGMMGQVDESIRRGLLRATLHLVNREYDALADDFVTLGMLPKDSEKAKVVPALTGVFAEALKDGVNNLSFGDLSGNLGRTMYQFKFQIPSYYTLLVRSLTVLEGIALASNPRYKVLGSAYPWIARRLLTDTTPELRATLSSLLYKDGKFNFRRMESLLVQAVRSPTSGFVDDVPRSTNSDAVALLLSPEASFVRGVVVEELAKGVDAAWRLAGDTVVETSADSVRTAMGDPSSSASTSSTNKSPLGSIPPPPLPPGSSVLLSSILDVLMVLPKLANEEDAAQVDGLRRLAVALRQAAPTSNNNMNGSTNTAYSDDTRSSSSANSGGGGDKATAGVDCELISTLENVSSVLQWLIKEFETLTPEQRTEALKLPIEVIQASSSRAVARLLRWVVSGEGPMTASSTDGSSGENGSGSQAKKSTASQRKKKGQRTDPLSPSAALMRGGMRGGMPQ